MRNLSPCCGRSGFQPHAYGGTLENLPDGIQVRPSDGLNIRFFNLTGRMSSSAADQGVNQTNFGTCGT